MSETEQKEHLQGDQEIDAFLSINEINKELSRLFEKRMILEGKTKQKKIPTAAEVAKITQSLTNRSKERGHETFCSILPKTKDKTFDDFSSAINRATKWLRTYAISALAPSVKASKLEIVRNSCAVGGSSDAPSCIGIRKTPPA